MSYQLSKYSHGVLSAAGTPVSLFSSPFPVLTSLPPTSPNLPIPSQVSEVFRHGVLHQPCPAAEVQQQIISRHATAASLLESTRSARYKEYYQPRRVTVEAASSTASQSTSHSNIVKAPFGFSSAPPSGGDSSPLTHQPTLVVNPSAICRNMTSDSAEAELMPVDKYR